MGLFIFININEVLDGLRQCHRNLAFRHYEALPRFISYDTTQLSYK